MDTKTLHAAALDDDVLDTVVGGVGDSQGADSTMVCPRHLKPVEFARSIRLDGCNVSLYSCPFCNRQYSLLQLTGEEDLKKNYTNIFG